MQHMTKADKIPLFYIMGPTCAGKGVLLEAAKARFGNRLGLVEVGKAFRAKYPPSHFRGQANPLHTRVEALKLYDDLLTVEMEKPEVRLILVDGQPREAQTTYILTHNTSNDKHFFLLTAPAEVRRLRAYTRFHKEPNSEALELALKRIDNDRITYYEVVSDLLRARKPIEVVETNQEPAVWTEIVLSLLKLKMELTECNWNE